MNISFIGFGNIAKSMAKKLAQNPSFKLRAAAPSLTIGVNTYGVETHSSNIAILADADIIVLAVKPSQMLSVIEQIRSQLPANSVLVSVASGLKLSWFGLDKPLVRAMPNIAAETGQSATPLIANKWVTNSQKILIEQLFSYLGITTWITEENQIDTFTAFSGSGPAYVFLFMEAMINAAVSLGLQKDIATAFTLQTIQGALSLAMKGENTPAALRAMVTSPAGTTAAAISVFENEGFEALVHTAMQAAKARAIELGQPFEK